MDETYDRIIDIINKKPPAQRELARRALLWIAFARKSITADELRAAVAIEIDTRDVHDFLSMIPTIDTVLDACSNLIVDDGRSIRFVHFSVEEYILSKTRKLDSSSIAALGIGPNLAQLEISRVCITFMLYCSVPDGSKFKYPHFSDYAHNNWAWHVRAVNGISQELITLVLMYFDFGAFFASVPPRIAGTETQVWMDYEHELQTKFSPSIIALIFDLPPVSNHLATTNNDHSRYPDEKYAMHYAARFNSQQTIERLCNQGFNVNVLDNDQKTPIYYSKSFETIRILLNNGADVNAHEGHALVQAAGSRQPEFVKFLLANGANSNVPEAFARALTSDCTEITEILLDAGADATARVGSFGHPLIIAAGAGSEGVVKLLLSRGADVNVNDQEGGHYQTALVAAASYGSEAILQQLLDRGADVNARGAMYETALQAAATQTAHGALVLLLAHGADVNAEGGVYGTALVAAASHGSEAMLQLLIDHGADVNAGGGMCETALHAAVVSGVYLNVKLLLDKGAEVNAEGGPCIDALAAAIFHNHHNIKQMLIDYSVV